MAYAVLNNVIARKAAFYIIMWSWIPALSFLHSPEKCAPRKGTWRVASRRKDRRSELAVGMILSGD